MFWQWLANLEGIISGISRDNIIFSNYWKSITTIRGYCKRTEAINLWSGIKANKIDCKIIKGL